MKHKLFFGAFILSLMFGVIMAACSNPAGGGINPFMPKNWPPEGETGVSLTVSGLDDAVRFQAALIPGDLNMTYVNFILYDVPLPAGWIGGAALAETGDIIDDEATIYFISNANEVFDSGFTAEPIAWPGGAGPFNIVFTVVFSDGTEVKYISGSTYTFNSSRELDIDAFDDLDTFGQGGASDSELTITDVHSGDISDLEPAVVLLGPPVGNPTAVGFGTITDDDDGTLVVQLRQAVNLRLDAALTQGRIQIITDSGQTETMGDSGDISGGTLVWSAD